METKTERHPSFGLMGISRMSGQATLFGSEVEHHNFICIRISEATVQRSLHREWYAPCKAAAEVWMSEAQFAQMITSPNSGEGVPCTIRYAAGGDKRDRELPPKKKPQLVMFKSEATEKMHSILDAARRALTLVRGMVTDKKSPTKASLKELQAWIELFTRETGANSEFLLESLKEAMEKTVASAVTEFEAHVSASLSAKGLSQLRGQAPELLLEGGEDHC